MNWFKDHSYVATWMSCAIGMVGLIAKSRGKLVTLDWHELVGLILLGFSFSIAVSPEFDESARTFARQFIYFLLGFGVLQIYRHKQ